jgi:hypothetical protein
MMFSRMIFYAFPQNYWNLRVALNYYFSKMHKLVNKFGLKYFKNEIFNSNTIEYGILE